MYMYITKNNEAVPLCLYMYVLVATQNFSLLKVPVIAVNILKECTSKMHIYYMN